MYSNGSAPVVAEPIPAHSEKAERAILGAILIDNAALFDVLDTLTADDFYLATNKRLYGAMCALHKNGAAIDETTLSEVIKDKAVTSQVYDLVIEGIDALHLADYARIVKAHSTRRKLTRAAGKIATLAADQSAGVDKLTAQAEAEIFAITQAAAPSRLESARAGMSRVFDLVQQRRDQGTDMVGLSCGFHDLDVILEGLEPGNLYIVAGRPGMGKSLFEDHVATHNARRGKRVIRFNLEMPSDQIWLRSIAGVTGLPFTKMRKGQLTDAEFSTYSNSLGELSEMSMWVDDSSGITLTQLAARCRRKNAQYGIDLVTIDYLQLMGVDGTHQNRNQEIGSISRGLTWLAKDLNVPVLALAQLSRSVEQRQDKRPMLSDLRDSGEIEQDADVVIMLYRDEYYTKDMSDRPNQVEANVVKHRNGPGGRAELYFDRRAPRLANLEKQAVEL
jgi:replicative DNA helicase